MTDMGTLPGFIGGELLNFMWPLIAGVFVIMTGAAVVAQEVERGKPAGLAAGLTLAFYLAWVLAGLSDRWRWLKRLSIFTAYKPQQALARGEVPVPEVLTLLAIGLACAVAALAVFRRRDAIA